MDVISKSNGRKTVKNRRALVEKNGKLAAYQVLMPTPAGEAVLRLSSNFQLTRGWRRISTIC